jgi:DNA-binding NtrC family response regulator
VRFLRVTAFLLRRRGFVVETAVGRGPAVRALEKGETDVVVVDEEGTLGAAARLADAMRAVNPRVAVVLCLPRLSVEPYPAYVVTRFAPPDSLAAEIERSYGRRNGFKA